MDFSESGGDLPLVGNGAVKVDPDSDSFKNITQDDQLLRAINMSAYPDVPYEQEPLKGDDKEEKHDHMGNGSTKYEVKRPKTCSEKFMAIYREHSLMILTITGVIIGFALGFGIREMNPNDEALLWLNMPGDIFIRLLKMTILPLIAANVIVVTSSLDPKVNGKISVVAFAYIICANVFSAILGLSCALIIKPGKFEIMTDSSMLTKKVSLLKTSDVFADLLYNIFPDNLVGACIFKSQTTYETKLAESAAQLTESLASPLGLDNATVTNNATRALAETLQRSVVNSHSVNMIGVLFCSFIFGMAARNAGSAGVPFLTFFKSLAEVVMKIMRWFLWLTPVGVCFMIAGSVAGLSDLGQTFLKLGMFIITVTVGLALHFIIINLVLLAVSRKNPLAIVPKSFKSWFISFATTAPVVAIPEMYQCCDHHGICPSVSRFVIPFAAALKGDGSAVFVTAAAVFVGQLSGNPLNAGTVVVIGLLTASAMMALPNIPSASIVILVTVLSSVGIDASYVGLLFAVEWLLDRMRSGSIGISHIYCTAVTYHICLDDLKNKRGAEPEILEVSEEKNMEMVTVDSNNHH